MEWPAIKTLRLVTNSLLKNLVGHVLQTDSCSTLPRKRPEETENAHHVDLQFLVGLAPRGRQSCEMRQGPPLLTPDPPGVCALSEPVPSADTLIHVITDVAVRSPPHPQGLEGGAANIPSIW